LSAHYSKTPKGVVLKKCSVSFEVVWVKFCFKLAKKGGRNVACL